MLTPPTTARVAKLLPLLASPHAGEVVAAAEAITRTLAGAGANWHDLVAAIAPAHPRLHDLADLLSRSRTVTRWERRFAKSIAAALRAGQRLTDLQIATLRKIAAERLVDPT